MNVDAQTADLDTDPKTLSVATFTLREFKFAIASDRVVEAIRMVAVKPLPATPPWLLGVLDLRGQLVPVVDLLRRISEQTTDYDPQFSILIAETDQTSIGFVIERLTGLHQAVYLGDDPSSVIKTAEKMVGALIRANDDLQMLLDLQAIGTEVRHALEG